MKIRKGFVSNSSSSSFVIITNKKYSDPVEGILDSLSREFLKEGKPNDILKILINEETVVQTIHEIDFHDNKRYYLSLLEDNDCIIKEELTPNNVLEYYPDGYSSSSSFLESFLENLLTDQPDGIYKGDYIVIRKDCY